ncbi:MAG TPA: glycosyltransferase [Bacteroidia bacterium]|jgi:glycosyltransferase involved in cell wall biosynthesis|nr:glycosyltransferase [Bacteroidia bacterium]HMU20032.1 glycosyltransferase [Bacteroidia bacterium]
MAQKKVIISVINDIATDQRVRRTASAFSELNYQIIIVGRKLPQSLTVYEMNGLQVKRFNMPINKGPLFYALFQVRLILFLIFKKADVLFSNDLDTLLPNYLVSRLKGSVLIYDSHEYFTGVPELQKNHFARKIWTKVESFIFPKLKNVITVNRSIANLYSQQYGNIVHVVRNVPDKTNKIIFDVVQWKRSVGFSDDKKVFILQGAGINIDRGAEDAVEAMKDVDALLLIIGGGDVFHQLKELAVKHNVAHKVIIHPKISREELMAVTTSCFAGLTLDKDTNINYRFSLPNKLFDYIHSEIPVIATDLPEVAAIVNVYRTGIVLSQNSPQAIANAMNGLISEKELYAEYKENCRIAATDLCWQSEKKILIDLILSSERTQ